MMMYAAKFRPWVSAARALTLQKQALMVQALPFFEKTAVLLEKKETYAIAFSRNGPLA